jgi:hypothetical protein
VKSLANEFKWVKEKGQIQWNFLRGFQVILKLISGDIKEMGLKIESLKLNRARVGGSREKHTILFPYPHRYLTCF